MDAMFTPKFSLHPINVKFSPSAFPSLEYTPTKLIWNLKLQSLEFGIIDVKRIIKNIFQFYFLFTLYFLLKYDIHWAEPND